MRSEPNLRIEHLRRVHPVLGASYGNFGYFVDGPLRIVSSGVDDENGWEHVSVSCVDRCPSWEEMQRVKELFWDDSETVLQFHPAKSQYVNRCEFCLHLWRRVGVNAELPPRHLVG